MFVIQGLEYKGFILFLYDIQGFDTAKSFRRHQHRERHLDEFFVLVDRLKGAADITADLGRSAMLNTKREHHDGSLQGELVFVDLEQHGREQV